jgi:serine/threonine protein kinase
MGKVWLARDVSLGRDVALKELQSETPSGKSRFLREAQVTGRLEHPGIVPVYEMGRDPETGRPFYVMRFIRGRTLTEVTADFHRNRRPDWYEPMELVRLLTAFVSVCQTIAYAHSHGIVHRDLKGENIILGEFGEVIVLDWGLAKRLDGTDDPVDSIESDATLNATAGRTMMGQVMGTPAYMAPEQADGRLDLIGPSTDVFGLGAVLYEILTGSAPFSGTTVPNIIQQAKRCEVAPPQVLWPEVPPGLASACLKALSKSPSDRYASAAELGQEVQGWQDRQRRQAEDDLRRAFDRLRRQQTALVELTRTEIFTSSDLSAIFRELVEVAARTLHVERVSIWRFTADRKAIHCHALYELSAKRHSSGIELNAETYPNYFAALAATDVIAADDAQRDPRTREFTDGYLVPHGIGAMMEVPIHPDGVLCHEHVGPPRHWLPDEQLFGIAVGHLAAHAISHLERRQALEQLALARGGQARQSG